MYMHNNNNYQCKMCCNKALTFGVGLPNTCKDDFNPNVIYISVKLHECFHFSAFHFSKFLKLKFLTHYTLFTYFPKLLKLRFLM